MRITLLAAILATSFAYADQHAITDTGDVVVLKSDKTWHYLDSSPNSLPQESSELSVNPKKFKAPSDASFVVKSKNNNSAFKINQKKWKLTPSSVPDQEYNLQSLTVPAYGMILTERMIIPLESLAVVAFENAKRVDPSAQLLATEKRSVNGLDVVYAKYKASTKGLSFIYYGYFTADDSGVTQYLVFTTEGSLKNSEMRDKIESEIFGLLNGMTAQ